MSYSARLVNATPLDVQWKYHRGIVLKIPAFGHLDITAQQMEQMMPDQPGASEIKKELDHYGLFLRDSNKTYEMQAEETLEAAIKAKGELYRECERGVRKRAADSGNLKEEAIQEELLRSGYTKLKEDVEQLMDVLKVVKSKNARNQRKRHDAYDPEKTLLFTNPPMVFESPLAMELFLNAKGNNEYKEQQAAFLAQMAPKPAPVKKQTQDPLGLGSGISDESA